MNCSHIVLTEPPQLINLRSHHFDLSPLAECREADMLREAVLSPAVLHEELSSDDERHYHRDEIVDERELYRARAAGRLSIDGEKMFERRERPWVSRLVSDTCRSLRRISQ